MQFDLIYNHYMIVNTQITWVGLDTLFYGLNVWNDVSNCLYVEPVIILDATDTLTVIFWGVVWFHFTHFPQTQTVPVCLLI